MGKKSTTGNLAGRSADDTPRSTPEELARLLAAMDGPVDTSDIPERKGPFRRIKRDAEGRLPRKRESWIREAILAAIQRRQMNRYQLWKAANALCPTLKPPAVYEFLRGRRDIGLPYVEALIQAAGLTVSIKRGGATGSKAKKETGNLVGSGTN